MFQCNYFGGTGGCAASIMADDQGITTDCQGCVFLEDVFVGVVGFENDEIAGTPYTEMEAGGDVPF